jgi:hypothetical protein
VRAEVVQGTRSKPGTFELNFALDDDRRAFPRWNKRQPRLAAGTDSGNGQFTIPGPLSGCESQRSTSGEGRGLLMVLPAMTRAPA